MRNFRRFMPAGLRTAVSLLAAVTLSSVVAGCGGSSSGAEDGVIKAALQPTAFSIPFHIAQQQGYFQEAGLTVQSDVLPNAGGQVPLIASGDAQFAVAPLVPIVVAKSQGLPLSMVASSSLYGHDKAGAAVGIVVPQQSAADSAADLVDKTVAVIGLKATPEQLLRNAVERDGGDADRVRMVQMDYPTGFSALARGEVEGMIVTQPFVSQALSKGFKVISYPELETAPGGMFAAWFANDRYLAEHPDDARAFVAAIERGNEYANAHPDEVNALLAEQTEMSPEAQQTLPDTNFGTKLDTSSIDATVHDVDRFGWSRTTPATDDLIWTS